MFPFFSSLISIFRKIDCSSFDNYCLDQFNIRLITNRNCNLIPNKRKVLRVIIYRSFKNKSITDFYNSSTVIIALHPFSNFHHCGIDTIDINNVSFNTVHFYSVPRFINFRKNNEKRACNTEYEFLQGNSYTCSQKSYCQSEIFNASRKEKDSNNKHHYISKNFNSFLGLVA